MPGSQTRERGREALRWTGRFVARDVDVRVSRVDLLASAMKAERTSAVEGRRCVPAAEIRPRGRAPRKARAQTQAGCGRWRSRYASRLLLPQSPMPQTLAPQATGFQQRAM